MGLLNHKWNIHQASVITLSEEKLLLVRKLGKLWDSENTPILHILRISEDKYALPKVLPNMLRSRCSQFVHDTFPNKLQRKGIVVVFWNVINLHRSKCKNREILLQLFEGKKKKQQEKTTENFPFHFPHYQLVASSSYICSSETLCMSLPVQYWAIR